MNIFPLGGVQGVQHPTVPYVQYGVLLLVVTVLCNQPKADLGDVHAVMLLVK